jgi:Flp pilus assembly protein TadG
VKRRSDAERGQALAEFAIVAPIALLLIFGIIDFARALYTYEMVGQAARVGTRYAIVHTMQPANCSDPSIGTAPCEQANSALILSRFNFDPNATTMVYTWEGASATCSATAQPGCYVQIEVDNTFKFVIVPGTITFKSTSRLTI